MNSSHAMDDPGQRPSSAVALSLGEAPEFDLHECFQDLIVAALRLAVEDLVAEPAPRRAKRRKQQIIELRRKRAWAFLTSRHAAVLAEMIGIPADSFRYQLDHLLPANHQLLADLEEDI